MAAGRDEAATSRPSPSTSSITLANMSSRSPKPPASTSGGSGAVGSRSSARFGSGTGGRSGESITSAGGRGSAGAPPASRERPCSASANSSARAGKPSEDGLSAGRGGNGSLSVVSLSGPSARCQIDRPVTERAFGLSLSALRKGAWPALAGLIPVRASERNGRTTTEIGRGSTHRLHRSGPGPESS